jgi:hypothetical protein
VLVDRAGTIQKITVAGLLPPAGRDMLFPGEGA